MNSNFLAVAVMIALAATAHGQTPKLLLHDLTIQLTPAYVAEHLTWIEKERPFLDGLMLRPDVCFHVAGAKPVSYEVILKEFSPLKNLKPKTLKHSFGMIFPFYEQPKVDFFDDWSIVVQNWRNYARVIREVGLKGIALDNEEYLAHSALSNYPDDCRYKDKSLSEYAAQARKRGREIMKAVVEEFPDIAVLHFHGPYLSQPDAPSVVYSLPDWNELVGPFFVGFVEGKGAESVVIDGGEMYCLRSKEDFATAYSWQKQGIASDDTDCLFIPAALRPTWRSNVSVSWGIYNQTPVGCPENQMTAETFGMTLENALVRADDYVWLYTEDFTLLKGDVRAEKTWVEAVQAAKAKAARR